MKEPITNADIRAGDLIRWESATNDGEAREYRATGHETPSPNRGRLYLLERTNVIPLEPTLGWLGVTDVSGKPDGSRFGLWADRSGDAWDYGGGGYSAEYVTGFIPAVAVPADALEELRAARPSVIVMNNTGLLRSEREAIDKFLAAVDAVTEELDQ